MSVVSLLTQNFRNLNEQVIELHPKKNFFIGDNGSGKSSLLEAVFFIGHGKSFRTTKVEHLAHHDKSNFVVSVKDDNENRLGISRDFQTQQTVVKINGEKQTKLSDLAKNIAVQIVTPESFKLFFGGAKERRRFFDLGLFHVKHEFSEQWKTFVKVLKHRNACLRFGMKSDNDRAAYHYWTEQFCIHSLSVSSLRSEYVKDLTAELDFWLAILLPKLDAKISVSYLRGWHQKKELSDILSENYEREHQMGYSQFGAQKFDVRFLIDRKPIELALSRGQQKLFLLALTFAQSKLIERVKPIKPILLIDDVGAELDIYSRSDLHNAIEELNGQILITAIDELALDPLIKKEVITKKLNELKEENHKLFHVKHGEILDITKVG